MHCFPHQKGNGCFVQFSDRSTMSGNHDICCRNPFYSQTERFQTSDAGADAVRIGFGQYGGIFAGNAGCYQGNGPCCGKGCLSWQALYYAQYAFFGAGIL